MANRRVILYLPPIGIPDSYLKRIELDTVSTSPSNQILLLPETDPTGDPFTFTIAPTTNNYQVIGTKIQYSGTVGKIIYVDWGDSTAPNTYTLTGLLQNLEHQYATSGTYTVTVSGDTNFLSKTHYGSLPATVTMTTALSALQSFAGSYITEVNGNLSALPSSLTVFVVQGGILNVTGSLSSFPSSMTNLLLQPSALTAFTGTLSSLTSTSYVSLNLQNLNGISGSLANLASQTSLTYFVWRLNSGDALIGSLSSIPDSLLSLVIEGEPNITGSINSDTPTSLLSLNLRNCGSNLTGSITGAFPANLYSLYLQNLPTIIGTLNTNIQSSIDQVFHMDNMDGLGGGDFVYLNNAEYIQINGVDAQYTYSSTTWYSLQRFEFIPPSSYGLSAADLHDLIVDLSYADWHGVKILTLTGANPAPNLSDPDIIAALARLDAEQVTYTFTV